MSLRPTDLRLIFDDNANRLELFSGDGRLLLACEARNAAVRSGTFGHWGPCPRGEFRLGAPRPKHAAAFGFWAIPVLDLSAGGLLARCKRSGVMLHGGGSGLPDPFASYQGWVVTHGCLRLQNQPLGHLVNYVKTCQANGGTAYLTVSGDAS